MTAALVTVPPPLVHASGWGDEPIGGDTSGMDRGRPDDDVMPGAPITGQERWDILLAARPRGHRAAVVPAYDSRRALELRTVAGVVAVRHDIVPDEPVPDRARLPLDELLGDE